MVLAHFGLQYEWSRFDFGNLPAQLAWALLALNFSWTVLLLAVASSVLYFAMMGAAAGLFARRFLFGVGFFWAIHGLYVWLNPIPLPARLSWVGVVLAVFPAIIIALHWFPLFAFRSVSSRERAAEVS